MHAKYETIAWGAWLASLGLFAGTAACSKDAGSAFAAADGASTSPAGQPDGARGWGTTPGASTDDGGPSIIGSATDASVHGCSNLQCQVHACPAGGSTTVSGVVYDPAGKNPLYDVAVYVPNAPVEPLPSGASCYSCADLYSGRPIASAMTDPWGRFTLVNVPDGANIPLVVQVGKWRRQLAIPTVAACVDNPQPDGSLRLPGSRQQGDMPNIAISTGGADTLECLLTRIGVDPAEYAGGAAGPGRVHIFQGSGGAPDTAPPAPASATALWNTKADLMAYDVVLLSCEGDETAGMNQQAMFDYANAGGRVFASHFHYAWFDSGPFGASNVATWTAGANDIGNIAATIVTTLGSGQPFPKGQALEQWLANVNALRAGKLPIQAARHNADVGVANVASQTWIVSDQNAAPAPAQYFTFDTPTGSPKSEACGRVVYSDLHVGAASGDYGGQIMTGTVPSGCAANDLSPQEKALEFMLFDLSSCLTPDTEPPRPPQTAQ